MSTPQVLNRYTLQLGDEGVYIGRPSKWKNPFPISASMTRDQVCDAFEVYLHAHPELMQAAKEELKGKNLICFCVPRRCHGDTLFALANGPFVDAVPFEHYRVERTLQTHGYCSGEEIDHLKTESLPQRNLLYFDTPEQFDHCEQYYRIDFTLERALVLLRQTLSCQGLQNKAKTMWQDRYDAVAYTPLTSNVDTLGRHGWLLFPQQQVTSITRLTPSR